MLRVIFGGEWVIDEAGVLDAALRQLRLDDAREVEIDGAAIARMDSTGAFLLVRTERELAGQGAKVRVAGIPEAYRPLVDSLEREPEIRPAQSVPANQFLEDMARIGRATCHVLAEGYELLGFIGRVTVETSEVVIRPDRELPWPAFVNQIEQTGLTALPII